MQTRQRQGKEVQLKMQREYEVMPDRRHGFRMGTAASSPTQEMYGKNGENNIREDGRRAHVLAETAGASPVSRSSSNSSSMFAESMMQQEHHQERQQHQQQGMNDPAWYSGIITGTYFGVMRHPGVGTLPPQDRAALRDELARQHHRWWHNQVLTV